MSIFKYGHKDYTTILSAQSTTHHIHSSYSMSTEEKGTTKRVKRRKRSRSSRTRKNKRRGQMGMKQWMGRTLQQIQTNLRQM